MLGFHRDSQYYLFGSGLSVDLMAFLRISAMNEEELQQALSTYEVHSIYLYCEQITVFY